MNNDTKLEKFAIECLTCRINQESQHSMLYVDWKKKYYMITCLNCQNMEAFDEFGKKVELKKTKIEAQIN